MSGGNLPLALPAPEAKPKRGRPKGSRNKRSLDLGRYIEAHYGGLTPGQQSAAICLPTAKEVKAAGGDVRLATAVKARELAGLLGCNAAEAWVLMAKERVELMAYVHQRQAPAAPPAAPELLPIVQLPEDPRTAQVGPLAANVDELSPLLDMVPLEVGPAKSDGPNEP